jgi:hypothetical protein
MTVEGMVEVAMEEAGMTGVVEEEVVGDEATVPMATREHQEEEVVVEVAAVAMKEDTVTVIVAEVLILRFVFDCV